MDKPFKIKRLKCGIKLLFVKDNTKDLVYFEFCIKNGKINQLRKEIEHAHMLEHMNGCLTSHKYPSAYENGISLSKIGAKTNATTSNYLTRYFIKSHKKYETYIFDLLVNSYMNFQIDESNFKQEKNSVIEEIQSKLNEKWKSVYEAHESIVYKNHPNSINLEERLKKTKKINVSDILKYRKKHYTCNNTTIIIGGNVNISFYMKKLNNIFSTYKSNYYKQIYPKRKIKIKEGIYYKKIDSKSNKLLISFNTKLNRLNKNKYILELINKLLTGDLSSRLYSLRTDYGLVYNIKSYEESEIYGKNHANFFIETDISSENISTGYKKIMEIIKNTKITNNEYKTIRNQIQMEKLLHLQDTSLEKYIEQYINYVVFNKNVITFKDKYKILMSCSKQSLENLLKTVFDNKKCVVMYGGAKKIKFISK